MPKIIVGLIKGRHELPVDEYIFQEIKDPSDIRTIEITALQWVEEKCHVKKTYVSVNGGVSIRRKKPDNARDIRHRAYSCFNVCIKGL